MEATIFICGAFDYILLHVDATVHIYGSLDCIVVESMWLLRRRSCRGTLLNSKVPSNYSTYEAFSMA